VRVGQLGAVTAVCAIVATLTLEIGCGNTAPRAPSSRAGDSARSPSSQDSVLLVGAGDIGDEGHQSAATYSLIKRIFETRGASGCPEGCVCR